MLESEYQHGLIKKLEKMFPGCTVMKMNANYRQGMPDLLILYYSKFALLEVKASRNAKRQPNQEYYINKWALTSFAKFIFPENEKEVLESLRKHFY